MEAATVASSKILTVGSSSSSSASSYQSDALSRQFLLHGLNSRAFKFKFKSSRSSSVRASAAAGGDSVVTLSDYGAGNVRSVRNAIHSLGFDIRESTRQMMGEETKDSESVVLQRPDSFGRLGKFGGKYVPETLMYALFELESAFKSLAGDQDLQKELGGILRDYVGRESSLYFAERLTEHYKHPNGEGPDIYLKREDLNHIGAHKINNAVGQVLLAMRLGKQRIIAETGAGQHGVATATVCARFGLLCVIYMGAQDMERQSLNVFRMRLLGAENFVVHEQQLS